MSFHRPKEQIPLFAELRLSFKEPQEERKADWGRGREKERSERLPGIPLPRLPQAGSRGLPDAPFSLSLARQPLRTCSHIQLEHGKAPKKGESCQRHLLQCCLLLLQNKYVVRTLSKDKEYALKIMTSLHLGLAAILFSINFTR